MAKTDYQQIARDIIEFLNKVKTESPDNVMTMFFVQKPSREKYVSFRPQISNEIQKKILSMILGPARVKSYISTHPYIVAHDIELFIKPNNSCAYFTIDGFSNPDFKIEL